MRAVSTWQEPLDTFIKPTISHVEQTFIGALDRAFRTLKRRLIYKQSIELLRDF